MIFLKKTKIRDKLISICLSIVLLIISFFTENFFSEGVQSYFGYISSKVIYFLLCCCVTYFLVYFFKNFRIPFYKQWAKNLLFVFIPFLFWILLCWPGIFTWDEFWVYEATTHFKIENWQSYLTSYFYLINMYFFPSAATIVFFQITFMSFVISWIITKFEYYFQFNKAFKPLLFVFISLWPSIVFSTLLTFRSTMLAILELWLIGYMYFSSKEKVLDIKKFIIFGFLTIILSTWRAEGIYHVIIIPLSMLFIYGKRFLKSIIVFSIISLVGVFIVSNGYSIIKQDNYTKMKYELTAFMNPISNILSDKNVNLENINLESLNKVIDLEKTKENAYIYETPSFWNGAVRENFTKEEFNLFKKEYLKLITLNPDTFISVRTRTLFAASGFSEYGYYVSDYINSFIQSKPENTAAELMLDNSLNYPISVSLRQFAINLLDFSKTRAGYINFAIIFWDFVPIVVILFVILCRVRTMKDPLLWMALICLGRIPILFLSEPGSYFMYYYPTYLAGIFVIIMYLLSRKEKNEIHSRFQY